MTGKNVFALVSAMLVLLLLLGCTQPVQPSNGSPLSGTPNGGTAEKSTVSFKYAGTEGEIIFEKQFDVSKGTNAFDVMRRNMQVDYDQYAIGVFVNSIEGTPAPEGYYLALYVNGEYAIKGIADYTIEEDISLEWKTEKIEAFGLE